MTDRPHRNRRVAHHQPNGARAKKSRVAKAKPVQMRTHLEVIEQLLHKPVDVMKDGQSTTMPALGAIMFQLVQKSLTGDEKAERARQQFEALALQRSAAEFEILFVDNEYTKAFAASRDGDDV